MAGFERFRFESLREILNKIQRNYPAFSRRVKEAYAVSQWEDAVGAIIAKHARPLRVDNQVLTVEVDHPIWRVELHHRKHQILEAINAVKKIDPASEPPAPPIVDISFVDPKGRTVMDPKGRATTPEPRARPVRDDRPKY